MSSDRQPYPSIVHHKIAHPALVPRCDTEKRLRLTHNLGNGNRGGTLRVSRWDPVVVGSVVGDILDGLVELFPCGS